VDLSNFGSLSTAAGAFIPIIPFIFLNGYPAVIWAGCYFSDRPFYGRCREIASYDRSWWSSGLEMTLVGALEGVVTYLIGMALGRIGG